MESKTFYATSRGGTFQFHAVENDAPVGDAPGRGSVSGFSPQSRRRLLRYLNSIDWRGSDPTLFVTLTYPDEVANKKMRERRNHRNAFVKKMERALGVPVGILWRQEWVKRKSGRDTGKLRPHFHLMLFKVRFIHYQNINLWWREATGFKGPTINTDIREIVGVDGAIRYIAKYLAKNPSLDIGTYLDKDFEMGRFWGVLRPSIIPRFPLRELELKNNEQIKFVLSAASKILRSDPMSLLSGFTILGQKGRELFDYLKNCS